MKDQLKKPTKTKHSKKHYLLENSEKVMNKNYSGLSISISGELEFKNAILLQRQFYKPNLELY